MKGQLTSRKIKLVTGRGGGHWYRVDGIPELLPSVTTILEVLSKPALVPWAKKVALENVKRELIEFGSSGDYPINLDTLKLEKKWIEDIILRASKRPTQLAEAAADLGTRAHQVIHEMLSGKKPLNISCVKGTDLERPIQGFLDWYATADFKITGSETRLYSERLGVAGSMDGLGIRKIGGGLVVLDWKTSKAIYNDYAYQVGGYTICVEELTGKEVEEAWIIRFPKYNDDPIPFEAKQVKNLTAAKRGFELCRELFTNRKLKLMDAYEFPGKQ